MEKENSSSSLKKPTSIWLWQRAESTLHREGRPETSELSTSTLGTLQRASLANTRARGAIIIIIYQIHLSIHFRPCAASHSVVFDCLALADTFRANSEPIRRRHSTTSPCATRDFWPWNPLLRVRRSSRGGNSSSSSSLCMMSGMVVIMVSHCIPRLVRPCRVPRD